jgi:hypothetical protein
LPARGEDTHSDICVIDVTDVAIHRASKDLGDVEYFNQQLPGNDPVVGGRVFFGGWPGCYRELTPEKVIHYGTDCVINTPVTAVFNDEFILKFELRDNWIFKLGTGSRKMSNYVNDHDFGGHSGAGVFRIRPTGEVPELIGFVKQYRPDDAIICTPVTKLRSNGTVKSSTIGHTAQ